jgi:hypothetical protein
MIRIDDRIPLVLLAEMAHHIGAELASEGTDLVIRPKPEPNALQDLIDAHRTRLRERARLADDLK